MFNYAYYKLGIKLANRLSLRGGYALARFISDLHYIYSHADRVAVLNNLRVILPDNKRIRRIALEVFRNFGIYLVDFFRTQRLDKETLLKKVKVINLELVDEALKQGKGVIAVTAHLCNWELAGLTMGFLGYPISAVAYPHKDERINNFFNFQRESKGLEVIPVGKAAKKCIENLRAN
ncbi:MAG: hypothetical protein PHI86_06735, partial [Candidatus Omnitrophica bacterium]|nr:hypothetical protein [Candidatus Omnitrophota bacterium]